MNIVPVTELENYEEVLKQVSVGSPVYLSVDGECKYVIVDMQEYNEMIKKINRFKNYK